MQAGLIQVMRSLEDNAMRAHKILIALVAVASTFAGRALAEDIPTTESATAKWMVEKERAWADMACGGKWVATEILANDFQGTAPNGSRYGKPAGEPPYDPKTQWSTDCRLDSADVRFFAADVAVVYGSESKTVALPGSSHERRCLVWSDMWLKREGKWQIIAVQDNRVDCPGK